MHRETFLQFVAFCYLSIIAGYYLSAIIVGYYLSLKAETWETKIKAS